MKRNLRPSPLSRTLALVPPAVALIAQHASGNFDAFAKIGEIEGESMDLKHPKWIDVESVQWNVERAISTQIGGVREVGAPKFAELSITKFVDKSSPKLFLNAVGGSAPIGTVILELMNTSTYGVFYRITLNDVLVSSQKQNTSPGAIRPSETISLNFARIKIEYIVTDAKGTPVSVETVGYDLATGKIQ